MSEWEKETQRDDNSLQLCKGFKRWEDRESIQYETLVITRVDETQLRKGNTPWIIWRSFPDSVIIKMGDSPLAEQKKDFSLGKLKIWLEKCNRPFHREQLQADGDCRISGFSLYVYIHTETDS